MYFKVRIPVWLGNLVCLGLLSLGGGLLWLVKQETDVVASLGGPHPGPFLVGGPGSILVFGPLLNTLLVAVGLLAGFLLLWIFSHCPAHWLAGRLVGIRFSHYFVGTSPVGKMQIPFNDMLPGLLRELIILPGIKTQRESMERASPGRKAAMYAAGPLVSMLVPLVVAGFILSVNVPPLYLSLVRGANPIFITGLDPGTGERLLLTLPVHELVRALFPLLAAGNLFLGLWFSPRVGCLSKAKRARSGGAPAPAASPAHT
ncbi:MAG: hypothetical protein HY558_03365 [Euryarchaeota archaeon]|nr:hypothetical protein [Euryarchaeota archaeon]